MCGEGWESWINIRPARAVEEPGWFVSGHALLAYTVMFSVRTISRRARGDKKKPACPPLSKPVTPSHSADYLQSPTSPSPDPRGPSTPPASPCHTNSHPARFQACPPPNPRPLPSPPRTSPHPRPRKARMYLPPDRPRRGSTSRKTTKESGACNAQLARPAADWPTQVSASPPNPKSSSDDQPEVQRGACA